MNINRINVAADTALNNKISVPKGKKAEEKQGVEDSFKASPKGQMGLVSKGLGSSAQAVFTPKFKAEINKVWELDLGMKKDDPEHFEPLITKDAIYLNADGFTRKIDFNGKEVWKTETGVSGYSSPSFDSKGNMYVVAGDRGDGVLISLDKNGKERWRSSTGERGCSHTPLITKDDRICLVTDGKEIRFFDTKGKCTWHAHSDQLMSRKPYLDDNGIIHITETGTDRDKDWDKPYYIVNTRKPSLRNMGYTDSLKDVFIDKNGNSYAFKDDKFRAKDIKGKEIWAIDLPGETTSSDSMIGPDGKMYIRVREHAILCVDPKTGKENWRLEGADRHETLSNDYTWGSDGTFYTTGEGGNWKLYAVKPDGSARWTNQDNKHIANPKIGADDMIFTGGESHALKAFDHVTGKKQFESDFQLAYGDNYAVCDNNEIVAFTRENKLIKLNYTTKKQKMDKAFEKAKEEGSAEPVPAPTIEESEEWVVIGGVKLKKNK